jgi:hypothetical protein
MSNVIGQGLSAYGGWRQRLYDALFQFRDWQLEQKLTDGQSDLRMEQVLQMLRDDRFYLAFVAEFSRGKSELINAIFFGDTATRILPSSAGRTTMCPTELLYDAEWEPSLRLLPIETRAGNVSIEELRSEPEEWHVVPFDPTDRTTMVSVLRPLTELKAVSKEEAQRLGFSISSDPAHEDGLAARADGMVEIPRWRHAIVNFPHPLLQRGLVILDTPGLNALGAEPELTLSMLASAHAVVFVLAADTGVTKSDLAVWRDHITSSGAGAHKGQLVVMNKIDVLWDEIREPGEVAREIQRQVEYTARTLGIGQDRVFPVSAQKAVIGRVRGDAALVTQSRVERFETALANMLIPAKRQIVGANVQAELEQVAAATRALNEQRLRDVREHIGDLQQLNTKNVEVVGDMMDKVRLDKENLEKNLQRFQATRSVFARQTRALHEKMGMPAIELLIAETRKDMQTSLTTGGLRSHMIRFLATSAKRLEESEAQAEEIHRLIAGVYQRLQEEHGLANVRPRRFSMSRYQRDIRRLSERNDHFVRGLGVVLNEQMTVVRRFFDTVVLKVKEIYQHANHNLESWLKTMLLPMEGQVREHQVQLRRRLESIKRIHQARDTLQDRLEELEAIQTGLAEQRQELDRWLREVTYVNNIPASELVGTGEEGAPLRRNIA